MSKKKRNIFLVILIIIIISIVSIFCLIESQKAPITENNKTLNNNRANAKTSLNFPTAYNTSEVTHPSVVSFKNKWNGYRYWMGVTPYPKGDSNKENPHIFASNDLINWQVPKGLTNPIDEVKDEKYKNDYNSDTHLIYNKDTKQLELYWRTVIHREVFLYKSLSTNGITWSKKQLLFKIDNRFKTDMYSPAIIYDNKKYEIWYISTDFNLYTRSSKDGIHWTEAKKIDIEYPSSKLAHWHLDVQKNNGKYEILMCTYYRPDEKTSSSDRRTMSLYYSASTNNKDYSKFTKVLSPSNDENKWDGRGLYRSSFFIEDGKYIVFYSGISHDGTRGVGLSSGKDITNLKGYEK